MPETIATSYSFVNSILHIPRKSSLLSNAGGMENNEIRRANLLLLIKEYGSAAALEELTGTDATYIRNIKNGERDMGNRLARRLEEKLGKPSGWMDAVQHGADGGADLEQLIDDYRRASPAWQLTLRLLAQVPADRQADAASAVNKVLAESPASATAAMRKPLFNSRHGNKREAQDKKKMNRTT